MMRGRVPFPGQSEVALGFAKDSGNLSATIAANTGSTSATQRSLNRALLSPRSISLLGHCQTSLRHSGQCAGNANRQSAFRCRECNSLSCSGRFRGYRPRHGDINSLDLGQFDINSFGTDGGGGRGAGFGGGTGVGGGIGGIGGLPGGTGFGGGGVGGGGLEASAASAEAQVSVVPHYQVSALLYPARMLDLFNLGPNQSWAW